MKKASKLGFSLIELSIVILIIGILIIGISKGARIIAASRLTAARTLTAGSPVNFLSTDLSFWLDTTSVKSFDVAETINGAAVTNWRDIKPASPAEAFDFSSSSTARPTYIASGTNGLPTLRFDGINDYMASGNMTGADLSRGGNQITVFAVTKYLLPMHDSDILWWDTAGGRLNLEATNSSGGAYFDLGICCGPDARLNFNPTNFGNRSVIITGVRRPGGYGAFRMNGREYISSSTGMTGTLNPSSATSLTIANGNNAEHGDYNEIIVFKTGLKNSEIAAIEKYLSQKWNIPLNGL